MGPKTRHKNITVTTTVLENEVFSVPEFSASLVYSFLTEVREQRTDNKERRRMLKKIVLILCVLSMLKLS